MMSSISRLTAEDIRAALELSKFAGWNQTAADWQVLLKLDAEGCMGLKCDGRLVATTTLVCYGASLAWVGMVLTHPEYRRRGYARQLVERALEMAEARGIHTVKLDATEQGRGLYESLGFTVEQEIERWSGVWAGSNYIKARMISPELDREAFGADRTRLLYLLAQHGRAGGTHEGFVLWRPGAHASFLGPCVARSRDVARTLLRAALGEGRWFWDLLPSNTEAVALAAELGFRVERRLVRMTRGAALRGNDTLVFGAGGFEFG